MASNIKGITVDISGDTSKLKASLKEVNTEIKSTENQLKTVERLLKMDPGNMDLLREKQAYLTNEIQNTKNKLDALRDAKKRADEEGIRGTENGAAVYDELNKQIAATEANLNSLNQKMREFGSANAAKIKEIGNQFQEVGGKIEDAGKKLSVFSAAAAGVIATGVSYNAEMEKYNTALTTLTGSSEKAAKIMEQIKKDASSTPFDVKGLTKANQLLLSTGLDADEARNTILALGDAISATGGGDDELSRMAVNLQQIKNLGKASSIDIKQFANAGIDIYGLLADYLHVSKEEAAGMTISWENLNGALIAASQEGGKYFNAMQKQSETFNGKISNLKDSLGQLVGSLTESLMPVISKVVDVIANLSNWFQSLSPEMQELIAKVLLVVAVLGPALIIVGKLVSSIGTILTLIPLLTNPISWIVIGITAVITALTVLYAKCEWFRNLVNTIFEFYKNAFTKIVEVVKWVINYQVSAFQKLFDFIKLIVDGIANFFTVILPNAFNTFISVLQTIIQAIIQYILDPIGTISEILDALLPKAFEWAKNVLGKIKEGFKGVVDVGRYIVEGIWQGILNAKDWLLNKIKSFASTITDGIKSFFGIESPSKVMRDQVGKYLAQGIGVGFDREMNSVISNMTATARQITDAISTELDVNAMPNVKNAITSQNFYNTKSYQNTTEIVRQPSNVILQLDRTKLGEVVVDAYNQRNKIVGVTL